MDIDKLLHEIYDGIEKAEAVNVRYEVGDRHPDFHGVVIVEADPRGADERVAYRYSITKMMMDHLPEGVAAERFGEEVCLIVNRKIEDVRRKAEKELIE